jgi:hypothetical protein
MNNVIELQGETLQFKHMLALNSHEALPDIAKIDIRGVIEAIFNFTRYTSKTLL